MPSTTEMDLGNEAPRKGLELKMGRWEDQQRRFYKLKAQVLPRKTGLPDVGFVKIYQSPHLEVDGSQGGEVYTFVLLLAMKHRQQTLPNWIYPTPGDCPRVNMGWFEHRVRKNRLITYHFLH